MTEDHTAPDPPPASRVQIAAGAAHSARVYDYLLGGSDHFAADRDAAARLGALVGGLDVARADARANRAFLGRAVRWLAAEAGIRQFLDIGSGIPNADNVHTIARRAAPAARVVAVDHDPVVLAHAHRLLRDDPDVAYVQGDLRDPDTILARAADTLDLGRPVAVLLVGVLHHLADDEDPHGIVGRLVRGLAPGSHLVVSHLAADVPSPDPPPAGMTETAEAVGRLMGEPWVPRDRATVVRFFAGLELVEPGVVLVGRWRLPGPPPAAGAREVPLHVGVARVP